MISSGILKSLLQVIAIILTAIVFPTTCTVIATYNNKWKEKEKRGLVNLLKMIPFLLCLIAVYIIVFVDGSAVYTLSSMAIGAIVFPTAIWVIMSLYHKIGRKRA
ncbi:MAG: hypothetical protein RR651_15280 [Lysinibacillus sp.]